MNCNKKRIDIMKNIVKRVNINLRSNSNKKCVSE